MFFGTREKEYELGSFTSEKCTACKTGKTYSFIRIVRYFVAFFINLIPIGTRFSCVCEHCGNVVAIDRASGKVIAKTRFAPTNSDVTFAAFLRVGLLVLVIAAAVVLPLMLVDPPQASPEDLAALVTEDGVYKIQNKNGDVLAYVEITGGEKTLTQYTTYQQLSGEPGADGMTMIRNYVPTADSTDDDIILKPNANSAGRLVDKYDIPIRIYHYDIANEAYGYATGIEDLSTIEYTDGKTLYPYTEYKSASLVSTYTDVLYIEDGRRVQARFAAPAKDEALQLSSVIVSRLENGRLMERTYYSTSSDSSIVFVGSATPDSTVEQILQVIEQSDLMPEGVETFVYYKDTRVPVSITQSIMDSSGEKIPTTADYDVQQQGRYYIVSKSLME